MAKRLHLPREDVSHRPWKNAKPAFNEAAAEREYARIVERLERDLRREAAERGAVLTAIEVRAAVNKRLERGLW